MVILDGTASGLTVTGSQIWSQGQDGIEVDEYAAMSAVVRQNPIGHYLGASFIVEEQTVSTLDTFELMMEHGHRLPS